MLCSLYNKSINNNCIVSVSTIHNGNHSQSDDENFVGHGQLAEVRHRQQKVEDRVRHHQDSDQWDDAATSHHIIIIIISISSTVITTVIFIII